MTRTNFSVSAAMGFVSVFGIAVQDALLMVSYFQQTRDAGLSIEKSAREAFDKRFRPGLMTTLVATLGLTPAAISHGIGSESQKPLAIVVIGGSLVLADPHPAAPAAAHGRGPPLARGLRWPAAARARPSPADDDDEDEGDDPDKAEVRQERMAHHGEHT